MVVEYIIIGAFTGAGQAIGTFFAMKYVIDKLEGSGDWKEKVIKYLEKKK